MYENKFTIPYKMTINADGATQPDAILMGAACSESGLVGTLAAQQRAQAFHKTAGQNEAVKAFFRLPESLLFCGRA